MDNLSKEKRSIVMRNIKGKNTKPELILRSALHELGYRFRVHDKKLPGTPDIVLKKFNTVIFVNGCFWHGHTACKPGTFVPKTNTEFWQRKIKGNQLRDETKSTELQKLGWQVVVVYECELKKRNIDKTLDEIVKQLK